MKPYKVVTLICTVVFCAAGLVAAEQPYNPPLTNAAVAAAMLPTGMSNTDVRHELQSTFDIDPQFNGAHIFASVTADSVRLDGWVDSTQQRDLAESLAKSSSGSRAVVNLVQPGGYPGW